MGFWLVRGGRGGELDEIARKEKFAAVRFREVIEDLSSIESIAALKMLFRHPNETNNERRIGNRASQLWDFVKNLNVSDIIAMPSKKRGSVMFGVVSGSYKFVPELQDSPHTRSVNWAAEVEKSKIPADIIRKLGVPKTVVRLERDDAELRIRTLLAIECPKGFIKAAGSTVVTAHVQNVPIEALHSESHVAETPQEVYERSRREALLVQAFCDFLTTRGHRAVRKQITREPGVLLYTDVFVEDLNLLVEAKGSVDRKEFRMAIGQLVDYRRFLKAPTCAILLPAKPSEDLITLGHLENIHIFWQEDEENFDLQGYDIQTPT